MEGITNLNMFYEAGIPGALLLMMCVAAYRITQALWQALQQRESDLRALLREMLERQAAQAESGHEVMRELAAEAARLRDVMILFRHDHQLLAANGTSDPDAEAAALVEDIDRGTRP